MKMSVARGPYLLFAFMSLVIQSLADNVRGPVFPDILAEFHLDNKVGSLFFSVASGMVIFGGYGGSYLIDWIGCVRTMRFSLVFLFIALFGISLSTSFFWLIMFVVFLGISFGIMGVTQNVMVIEASPEKSNIQRWQSGLQSMYGLSSFIAPFFVSFLYKTGHSWRSAFSVSALLVVLLLLASFLVKEIVERQDHSFELSVYDQDSKKGSRYFEMFYFAMIFSFYVAAEIMISTRLVQFVRDLRNWSVESANELNAFFFILHFLGRAMLVFWKPSLDLTTQMFISLGGAIITITLGILSSPWFFVLSGLCLAPFYPLWMTLAREIFPKNLNRVAGLGIGMTGVTVVMMQTLVGFLSDRWGLELAFFVGPLFAVVALLLILFYEKTLVKITGKEILG